MGEGWSIFGEHSEDYGMSEFRLLQNDMVVAQVSGPLTQALAELYHYAIIYGQDGPVKTEYRVGKEWLPVCKDLQYDQPNANT